MNELSTAEQIRSKENQLVALRRRRTNLSRNATNEKAMLEARINKVAKELNIRPIHQRH